jgi:hypothetical protein
VIGGVAEGKTGAVVGAAAGAVAGAGVAAATVDRRLVVKKGTAITCITQTLLDFSP